MAALGPVKGSWSLRHRQRALRSLVGGYRVCRTTERSKADALGYDDEDALLAAIWMMLVGALMLACWID